MIVQANGIIHDEGEMMVRPNFERTMVIGGVALVIAVLIYIFTAVL